MKERRICGSVLSKDRFAKKMKKTAVILLCFVTMTVAACGGRKDIEETGVIEETVYPVPVDQSALTEELTEIDTGGPAASYYDSVKIYGNTVEIGKTQYRELAGKGFSTQEEVDAEQTVYEWENVEIPFLDANGNKVTFYFQGDTSQPVKLYDARLSGFYMESSDYHLSEDKERLIGIGESAESSSESTIRLTNAFGVDNGFVRVVFKDDGTPKQIEYHVDNINF